MRIAQVAPLCESVPPKAYGGTERVVSYLTEELVAQGHDVTLFASADSQTGARLISCAPRSLRLDDACKDSVVHHILMLERVLERVNEFDVIHFHVDYLHFPVARHLGISQLTTLHGRLDLRDLAPLFAEFDDMPVVSISDAQRAPLPDVDWVGTVHHGLPLDLHRLGSGAGGYFAFLGRISREKRVDRAIAIAKALGVPLKIAAKVDRADAEYFEREIKGLLDDPLIEFIGEIGEADKTKFLGEARALLFPIDWPEPFGLVMIEAMACGTPVIAFRGGSVSEVVENGVTGFVVDDLASAIDAARRVTSVDRASCRASFERRFSSRRMAKDYVTVYTRVIESARRRRVRMAKEAAA